jgi:hypothetical protein
MTTTGMRAKFSPFCLDTNFESGLDVALSSVWVERQRQQVLT